MLLVNNHYYNHNLYVFCFDNRENYIIEYFTIFVNILPYL